MTKEEIARSMAEADADMKHADIVELLYDIYLNGSEAVSAETKEEHEI